MTGSQEISVIIDNTDWHVIKDSKQDMLTTVIVYRLSVYFSLCLTVSSLYLPEMKVHIDLRRQRNLPFSVYRDSQQHHRQHRSTSQEISPWNKRSVYNVFSNMMTRHAARHNNDKAFVDRMFNIFDLDGDNMIERREFKAVLQILGIVSHHFR